MSSRAWGLVLVVAGVVGLALTSIGGAAGPSGTMTGPGGMMAPGGMGAMHARMQGSTGVQTTALSPVPGATEVRVVAKEFSLSPSGVSIPAGETFNMVLVNEGELPHDITIPSLGFRLTAAAGTSVSGALTVSDQGRYEFLCSIPGHRDAGMDGTLSAT